VLYHVKGEGVVRGFVEHEDTGGAANNDPVRRERQASTTGKPPSDGHVSPPISNGSALLGRLCHV
jgi:hypothetical protein